VTGRLVAAAAGALAARGAYAAVARLDGPRWQRTNHRGHTLTLLEGPAFAAGAAAAVALAPGLAPRARAAGVLALLGSGAVGAYDDLGERRSVQAKGFAGHLAALRQGRVTSGAVKVAGIGATGLAAAALLSPRHGAARLGDALLGGAVVAGYANLANLFDLRPGRALKFGLLHAPALVISDPCAVLLAAPLGAAAALLPVDLGEQAMLGDAGANALGAALGTAVLLRYGSRGRTAHVLGLAALTAASEKVSFTRVIAATPPLRWFDELGRRPAPGR
jgi:UDP-GlcNAc:undecaprenyl-phosphate GlcNAc-1-phosphate transferase